MAKRKKRIFFDTEFLEAFTKPLFGKPMHFIDLISIGMVDENNQRYYAISKDADYERAWNTFDMKPELDAPNGPETRKEYWVRDHVLTKIFWELVATETDVNKPQMGDRFYAPDCTLSNLQTLVKRYGKTRKQIATDIYRFVFRDAVAQGDGMDGIEKDVEYWLEENEIEFYAHFADYDWVAFCALFGRMIKLPTGFPQYCNDTKQMFVSLGLPDEWKHTHCPDPEEAHNALVDAEWCRRFFFMMVSYMNSREGLARAYNLSQMPDYKVVTSMPVELAMRLMKLLESNPTVNELAVACYDQEINGPFRIAKFFPMKDS